MEGVSPKPRGSLRSVLLICGEKRDGDGDGEKRNATHFLVLVCEGCDRKSNNKRRPLLVTSLSAFPVKLQVCINCAARVLENDQSENSEVPDVSFCDRPFSCARA